MEISQRKKMEGEDVIRKSNEREEGKEKENLEVVADGRIGGKRKCT